MLVCYCALNEYFYLLCVISSLKQPNKTGYSKLAVTMCLLTDIYPVLSWCPHIGWSTVLVKNNLVYEGENWASLCELLMSRGWHDWSLDWGHPPGANEATCASWEGRETPLIKVNLWTLPISNKYIWRAWKMGGCFWQIATLVTFLSNLSGVCCLFENRLVLGSQQPWEGGLGVLFCRWTQAPSWIIFYHSSQEELVKHPLGEEIFGADTIQLNHWL